MNKFTPKLEKGLEPARTSTTEQAQKGSIQNILNSLALSFALLMSPGCQSAQEVRNQQISAIYKNNLERMLLILAQIKILAHKLSNLDDLNFRLDLRIRTAEMQIVIAQQTGQGNLTQLQKKLEELKQDRSNCQNEIKETSKTVNEMQKEIEEIKKSIQIGHYELKKQ